MIRKAGLLMQRRRFIVYRRALALIGLVVIASCSAFIYTRGGISITQAKAGSTSLGQAITTVPRPDHVVIVVEENHAASEVIGSSAAPYINALASQGALLANSHAITHPSEPNYLALFAGSTFGLSENTCPLSLPDANLAQELIQARNSFGGYLEDLPSVGYTGCKSGKYTRSHNPWVSFTNVPSSVSMPFSSFPTDFSLLPTVSIVVPSKQNDMHDGTIEEADIWLKNSVDSYIKWAEKHKSLLIVTWDEDDKTSANLIPTIFVGSMVKSGIYNENVNHYNVLRTLETMYGLPYIKESANVAAITDIWQDFT